MAIKHLFFDCDNTLVESEDVAFGACAGLVNEIMEKYGLDQRYTPESLIANFLGQNFRGIMAAVQTQFDFRLGEEEMEGYIREEAERVIAQLQAKVQPCDGSIQVLQELSQNQNYTMSVVSSSALRRVLVAIATTGQDKFFHPDEIYSAATSLAKPSSKPDPAIYLHVLAKHSAKPEECVAVEDSISGALSAIGAKVAVIGYVGAYHTAAKRDEIAMRLTEVGCKHIMYNWADFEKCLEIVEHGQH